MSATETARRLDQLRRDGSTKCARKFASIPQASVRVLGTKASPILVLHSERRYRREAAVSFICCTSANFLLLTYVLFCVYASVHKLRGPAVHMKRRNHRPETVILIEQNVRVNGGGKVAVISNLTSIFFDLSFPGQSPRRVA